MLNKNRDDLDRDADSKEQVERREKETQGSPEPGDLGEGDPRNDPSIVATLVLEPDGEGGSTWVTSIPDTPDSWMLGHGDVDTPTEVLPAIARSLSQASRKARVADVRGRALAVLERHLLEMGWSELADFCLYARNDSPKADPEAMWIVMGLPEHVPGCAPTADSNEDQQARSLRRPMRKRHQWRMTGPETATCERCDAAASEDVIHAVRSGQPGYCTGGRDLPPATTEVSDG